MVEKISNKDLIDNLKELIEKLGRTPKQRELNLGKYSSNAYKRAFGTYSNALKEIGLLPKIQFGLTDQDIINDVLRISKELGTIPRCEDFDKYSKTLCSGAIINRFKTWNNILQLAGLQIENKRNVLKEDVIKALRDWYAFNNNDISCLEYWSLRKAKKRGEFLYSTQTISSKFDNKSWEDIMKECGFDYETVDQFIKRGCFLGYDGRTYLSSIEKQVGDLLNNLKKEGRINDYEYEKKVCGDRNWTCDFVIEDNNADKIWLEIDGMLNNRKDPYISDENEKIEYYKSKNFNYFIISYRTPDIKKAICELIGE